MDFDDLLFKTNVLLRDFPDLLHKYQQKFAFILVDEYQDTNFAQYLIIRQLGAARENVCVVGDDAQSIYSFRGANIQNILNFQRATHDCVVTSSSRTTAVQRPSSRRPIRSSPRTRTRSARRCGPATRTATRLTCTGP